MYEPSTPNSPPTIPVSSCVAFSPRVGVGFLWVATLMMTAVMMPTTRMMSAIPNMNATQCTSGLCTSERLGDRVAELVEDRSLEREDAAAAGADVRLERVDA